MDAITTISRTRQAAINALVRSLQTVGTNRPTEAALRDAWRDQLENEHDLRAEGWYVPPPHGLAVLIDDPPGAPRLSLPSLRPEASWPESATELTDQSLLYVYASPVDKQSGLIGDFAAVLYAGTDDRVREHWLRCWQLVNAIAEKAEVGMTYAHLYRLAMAMMSESGLRNAIYSVTDPAATNIGHTIPFALEAATNEAAVTINGGSDADVAALISSRRVFISAREHEVIRPGSVFTIEPRMGAAALPTIGFHVMVAFDENGMAHVINGLPHLFEAYESLFRG